MKKINITILVITAWLILPLSSCDDLDELNISPNSPEVVSSNYILTYVLTETSKAYNRLGREGENIPGAMQYVQRGTDYGALEVNSYEWEPESWANYYALLRNNDLINKKAVEDGDIFLEGVSLVMKSFLFGLTTDLFGDCPYSESLSANDEIYFPKYDEQKDIYKGILEDLKKASDLLADVDVSIHAIPAFADVIYQGDPIKWEKFANSLRLRYCLRLYNKSSEMNTIGMNIVTEFNDAVGNVIENDDDAAIMEFLGITADNSIPGGPLATANPTFGYKPCQTIIEKLTTLSDPRMHRWTYPVIRKWDLDGVVETEQTITNIFGEVQTVTFVPEIPGNVLPIDSALYVGLPPGLAGSVALVYNRGGDPSDYSSEKSPYISNLSAIYRENANDYVKVRLMTLSEVEFILAEASVIGGFNVPLSAEQHYKNGIQASFDDYGVENAIGGFDFDDYYSNPDVKLSGSIDQQERIIEQKWISQWMGIESWFDWRRTGFPDLQTGPVAVYGDKLPLRFMYPSPNLDPKYLENYNEAVNRLEVTPNVPTGQSKDHSYSKMWLLQGTDKPW